MISAHESASGGGCCTSGFNRSPLAAVDAADYSLRPSTDSSKKGKMRSDEARRHFIDDIGVGGRALRFGNTKLRAG